MGFDWSGYLRVAERISADAATFDRTTAEAMARTAISRAYYAVAMTARSELRYQGVEFSRGGSVHQEIILRLRNADNPSLSNTALHLAALRRWRNLSDYEEEYTAIGDLHAVLVRARACMDLLKASR